MEGQRWGAGGGWGTDGGGWGRTEAECDRGARSGAHFRPLTEPPLRLSLLADRSPPSASTMAVNKALAVAMCVLAFTPAAQCGGFISDGLGDLFGGDTLDLIDA